MRVAKLSFFVILLLEHSTKGAHRWLQLKSLR
nr:MAG TPA: hypothetical protein [Caudoviricetes sp.]